VAEVDGVAGCCFSPCPFMTLIERENKTMKKSFDGTEFDFTLFPPVVSFSTFNHAVQIHRKRHHEILGSGFSA
jgi:hypothetical protein